METILLLTSIVRNVSLALMNPAISGGQSGKVNEWVGYLNLAAFLAERVTETNTELQALNEQIERAVSEGRGLTPEERAEWRRRDDIATGVAERWLAEHPEDAPIGDGQEDGLRDLDIEEGVKTDSES